MDMQKILKTVLFTPGPNGTWGLPLLCEGSPGTAKTSMIEGLCESWGLPCETVIASLREPTDFLGLPVPTENGLEYLPPSWAKRLTVGSGVAFLDELSTAAPSVQNALLRVVLDRVVGDLRLPGVRFIGAMNRCAETAGGYELATALANRFIHLDWEAPSVSQWTDYLMGGSSDNGEPTEGRVAAEETRVLSLWDSEFAQSRGVLVGFASKAPQLIHDQPKAIDPKASRAWPSRRSWEMAARAIAGAAVHGLNDEERTALIAGCVGVGAAMEFLAYQVETDMPNPEDLLDGKVKWKPNKRMDRTTAVLAACTAVVLPVNGNNRMPRAEAFWELLATIVDTTPDLVLSPARALVKNGLKDCNGTRHVIRKLGPLLQAVGNVP